ncbi:endoplasmic reticulum membrane protein [Schizosaccharomyces cryophilus OY26]|uniref:Endoplasmic reticulum membrane protein n=1 Tax=Schizosaccharomyces cryophilus (strain OY26 / ATCC MYA-4695 / CBS 11777 / NBRC 106824 / NRRL Y48691) TaxID=653667 RepID=S9X3A1_SCHCR|nr:endoplasmic reticulum membrane protein [Schizosaccharomyces cryophilus OY26]EPY51587.1 endoplasmic reticulum membrane protein [Schizosaccharomyces cryophilus OY26]
MVTYKLTDQQKGELQAQDSVIEGNELKECLLKLKKVKKDIDFKPFLRGIQLSSISTPLPNDSVARQKELMKKELDDLREKNLYDGIQLLPSMAGVSFDSQLQEKAENKKIKNQLSAIINILFTVIGSAFAVWCCTSSFEVEKRVAMCGISSILVLIADTFLYTRFLSLPPVQPSPNTKGEVVYSWSTNDPLSQDDQILSFTKSPDSIKEKKNN